MAKMKKTIVKASPIKAAGKPKAAPTFTCKTCGRVTKTQEHLCAPQKTKEAYICTYCGATSGTAKHICSPMLADMKYFCKFCGRVTPFRGAVCQPAEIK
jgi:hypothetical protein